MIELSSQATGDVESMSIVSPETPGGLLHDLRTPLNLIVGYAEILTEQAQADGRPGYVKDLQHIRSACSQLDTLINRNFQPASSTQINPILRHTARPSDAPNAPLAGDVLVTETQHASRAASGRILIVDDNDMNRDLLAHRLKGHGHQATGVNSGIEALAAVRTEAFDLVLLDIMMPKMDGYEVLHHLKSDRALRHIPVIMVSALNNMQSVVRCIEMGADDYLCQPFDPTLLRARIGSCLEKKREYDSKILLHEELRQSYKQLKEVEKMRDDLTFLIVHDVSIPLTSVFSGIQALDAVDSLTEAQRKTVAHAVNAGEVLIDMINNLPGVVKLESGSAVPQRVG